MVLIIFHHIAVHGVGNITEYGGVNSILVTFMSIGGKIGVALFVLISGYYMCDRQISYKKVAHLYGQVFFYSAVIGLIFYLTPELNADIGTKEFVFSFFPIIKDQYWFFSCYFFIVVLSPLFNTIADNISKKAFQNYLIGFSFLWCFLPVLNLRSIEYRLNNLIMLIFIYFVAMYIKKYVDIKKQSPFKHLFFGFLGYVLLFLSAQATICVGNIKDIEILKTAIYKLMEINSILVLIPSCQIFVGVLALKPHHCSFINLIAGSTFGVYLIHDNNFVRPFLWKFLKIQQAYDSDKFLAYTLIIVAAIFVICVIIDLIRRYTIDKLYLFLIDKTSNCFDKLFNCILNGCKKFVFKDYDNSSN